MDYMSMEVCIRALFYVRESTKYSLFLASLPLLWGSCSASPRPWHGRALCTLALHALWPLPPVA